MKTAPPWQERLRATLHTAWRWLRTTEHDRRDRYLARAGGHADLERRMRAWDDAERRPWLPPR